MFSDVDESGSQWFHHYLKYIPLPSVFTHVPKSFSFQRRNPERWMRMPWLSIASIGIQSLSISAPSSLEHFTVVVVWLSLVFLHGD